MTALLLARCSTGCSAAGVDPKQQQLIQKQTAWLRSADPSRDVEQAFVKRDFRFYGVYGYTLSTPGAGNVEDSPLAKLGVKAIQGTSDFIQPGVEELNKLAYDYAHSYNRALIKELRAARPPHPAVAQLQRQIAAELWMMERGKPALDMRRNLARGDGRSFYAVGIRSPEMKPHNVTEEQWEKVYYNTPVRILAGSQEWMTPAEYQRWQRGLNRYAWPYNRLLFQRLLARKQKASSTSR